MPIFSSTGGTIPSLSSSSAASRWMGRSSGLPCSEASSFARWTASCALTVNLSQRIGMGNLGFGNCEILIVQQFDCAFIAFGLKLVDLILLRKKFRGGSLVRHLPQTATSSFGSDRLRLCGADECGLPYVNRLRGFAGALA